jgi:signal peptidase I
MAPTLRDGDRLLVRRGSAPPDRGDVVVFRHPGSRAVGTDPALRVKRVAAVAGDPTPAWVSEGAAVDHRLRTVPDGQLVVHGDARLSRDSRQLGLVPVSALVGTLPDPRPPRRGVAPRPTPPTVKPGWRTTMQLVAAAVLAAGFDITDAVLAAVSTSPPTPPR